MLTAPLPQESPWSSRLGATRTLLDASEQVEKARKLDVRNAPEDALLAWERVIDRCDASVAQRTEATTRVRALRPHVRPLNESKPRAKPWRTLVVVFDELDFRWEALDGTRHAARLVVDESDSAAIARSIDAFGEHVFRSSSGIWHVQAKIEHVKSPLRELSGSAEHGFWLAPSNAHATFERLVRDQSYDSVFAYVKMSDGRESVPTAFWGGTYGGDLGPGGAGYTTICWNASLAPPDGEVEFHEWLHQIDWMFTNVQRYPDELVPNPDTGRDEGQEGGDLDFRRAQGEPGWMSFYRHIAEEHITRLMWDEAGMHSRSRSPLQPDDLAQWTVLGPFDATSERVPLMHEFVNEAKLEPKRGARVRGRSWRVAEGKGKALDLGAEFDTFGNAIAYAATRVRASKSCDAELQLGSDDGVRVWLNGRLIHTNDTARPLETNQDRVRIRLESGWNTLVFKVHNRGGGWLLQARIVDREGRVMRALENSAP